MTSLSLAGGPPRYTVASRVFLLYAALLVAVLVVAAMTSEASAWKPASLVIALTVVMVLADVAVVWSRRLRVSAGLLVQTTIMALLGPAPAAAIAVASIFVIDAVIFRIEPIRTIRNLAIVAVLGLAAGSCSRRSAACSGSAPRTRSMRRSCCRSTCPRAREPRHGGRRAPIHPAGGCGTIKESGLPALPLELVNAVLAATAVLLWTQGGVDAAVGLLAVLVVVIPLDAQRG